MSTVEVISAAAGEVLQIGPIRIRVLEDGSHTDNRLGAVEITVPPGVEGPPPHVHQQHDETFLVMSGVLRFTAGDKTHDAKAGDYVVVPVGAPRTFANVSTEPAVVFNSFTPAFYVDYLREIAGSPRPSASAPRQ